MGTVLNLKPGTLEALRDLVRTKEASADFYAVAFERIKSPVLAREFVRLGRSRANRGKILGEYLEVHETEIPAGRTLTDGLRETWTRLRTLLDGDDDYALLIEVERAEQRIKGTYETLIEETAGSPLSRLLHDQHAEVKATHNQIRALRDVFRPLGSTVGAGFRPPPLHPRRIPAPARAHPDFAKRNRSTSTRTQ